eukprot:TRINITY_DN2513_c0_g2_i1.p1 TRINITY_DN2513_c0_g2~~TRINITY_DN2513_c0_g2_i1.p1  ORF type:complete len:207 (-),score=44.44 TRINITY_DN2513_c0_g2_i1:1561-2124(-)
MAGLRYTFCYCEENVHQLCRALVAGGSAEAECFAVWCSNAAQKVPFWNRRDGGCVVWDYHVFCAVRRPAGQQGAASTLVYDPDAPLLPFPCPFERYCAEVLRPQQRVKPLYRKLFRVVPAADFLKTFSSDRSHMLTPQGTYYAPPPTYPPIQAEGQPPTNLAKFKDMTDHGWVGSVADDAQIVQLFG